MLDQGVDRTYPANTRCLATHDDMMKDRIEQVFGETVFVRTFLIKHFLIKHCSGISQ